MKITLPLSFLLCLPGMAKADKSTPNAKFLRSFQGEAVDIKAKAEHRQLGSKSNKFSESGQYPQQRRKAKAGKVGKPTQQPTPSTTKR